jgi:hypothetical protein
LSTSRAAIQKRYRNRKASGQRLVTFAADPASLAEILHDLGIAVPDPSPETLAVCLETMMELYEEGRLDLRVT